MVKVLFVCTGNVFRSLSAEYLLKKYLADNKITGVSVSSAGTESAPQPIDPDVVLALRHYGVDVSGHKQRVLTKELIEQSDLVVAMALYHQKFIKKHFWVDIPLFNEVAGAGKSSVWDVNDVIEDYLSHREAVVNHIKKTVQHIHDFIPSFYQNLRSRVSD